MPRIKSRDSVAQVPELTSSLDQLNTIYSKMLSSLMGMFDPKDIFDKLSPEVEKMFMEHFGGIPQVHKLLMPDGEEHPFAGTTHEMFDTVLNLVNLDIPVYLYGPAGVGKNYLVKQVAEALGKEFYFSNAVTQEYTLTGYRDANGIFHETQFYDAFSKGGIFFLDEIDASIPEVLIILNAAIANRYFNFPCGRVYAHPDFRVVAAGNTLGTGADAQYTGRYCLDRASLDRFAIVHIDYSPKIDLESAGGDSELAKFAQTFREVCSSTGIQCLCSYRSISRIHAMESVKLASLNEIMKMALVKDLDIDDINILHTELKKRIPSNKYVNALE